MNPRAIALAALLTLVAAVVVVALVLTASPRPDVVIGSKKFTESVILGEIARALIDSQTDSSVGHREELGGTTFLFEGLLAGEIDLYPDYSGTILRELLASESFTSIKQAAAHLESRGIAMTPPLGFNNTYAIAVRPELARRLNLKAISDLANHPDLVIGFGNEFLDRADGWPALKRAYNLPHTNLRGLDHDLAYAAIAQGQIDVIDAYSTDAGIEVHDLVVLEDDENHFPTYDALFLYRADLQQRAPDAVALIESLAGAIDETTMRALNERVEVEGQSESDAASVFLASARNIDVAVSATPLARRLLDRTAEHILLVAIPLALGILTAVPLGILAARRERTGHAVLALFGIIQTIPSLALLALMIPVLGIGDVSAIAALTLYALLPLARGAHAGIKAIPPTIEESAEALGLTPTQRLIRIDLPLAGPSIMAGIKTAAVILIGFATLGALIGAGGYGQPILTGIRLRSTPLILEGAIPAAALAVVAQILFEALERLIIPRGLRLKRAV